MWVQRSPMPLVLWTGKLFAVSWAQSWPCVALRLDARSHSGLVDGARAAAVTSESAGRVSIVHAFALETPTLTSGRAFRGALQCPSVLAWHCLVSPDAEQARRHAQVKPTPKTISGPGACGQHQEISSAQTECFD